MVHFLAYVLVAAVLTWPLVVDPVSRLAALEGPGDPYLNLWILGWDLQAMTERPWDLLTGRLFDANIFHPARQTLAYSDHLILQAVAVWPLYAVSRDPVLCYNAVFFFSLPVSAIAMHAFVRAVTGSTLSAYAAGIVWGFWPYHFAHLVHLQLQALYFLPLSFFFLHRLVAGRRAVDAVGLGATAGLQGVASVYYGVIGFIGLVAGGVGLLIGVGRWRAALLLRRLLLAAIVAVAVLAPFVWPYWQVQQREGFARNLDEASRHAATLDSYLQAPPSNLLYGRTQLLTGAAGPERELFPGLIVIALAGLSLWHVGRRLHWPAVVALTAVAVTGLVLSLGPEGVRAIYVSLHRTVFGFHAIRAPARFGVLVTFGLAGLAAIGLRHVRWPGGYAPGRDNLLRAGLVGLMLLEYANAPLAYVDAPSRRTPLGQWLRHAPQPGAVVHLPIGLDRESTPPMLQSLEHGRPLVNGYSGQRPGFYTAVVDALSGFPSPAALRTLRELDVRYVVAPEPVDMDAWPLVERARIATRGRAPSRAIVYELAWTPEAEARLAAAESIAPPPEPGPFPFEVGETVVYEVQWQGAGRSVPAGEATLHVASPQGVADALDRPDDEGSEIGAALATAATFGRFRFVVTASTAPWVSAFFEARDRFETVVDADLLPVVHARQIREGRRRVDQIVRFDRTTQTVRVVTGSSASEPGGLALPALPHARDSVTAFYYARTLALEPGSRLRIPLNEGGRNLILDLRGGPIESIPTRTGRAEALRVDLSIVQQVARRKPVGMATWLSLDARRVPLVVEVSAGFGSFRAELAAYKPR